MLVLIEKRQDNTTEKYVLNGETIVTALPDAVYTVTDTETDQPPEGMIIKQDGKDLEVEVDNVRVAKIAGFFGEDADTLFSADGSLTPMEDMAVAGNVTDFPEEGSRVVWQAEGGDANYLGWTAGLLALGGIGLAASEGGSSSGGSEPAPPASYSVNITAAAGPFTSDVRVEVYDKDGNLLETTVHNFGASSLQVTLSAGYAGPVFVKVIDNNDTEGATPDFRNETGEVMDLSFDLRAMAMADGTGDVHVTVSPLTEMAVRAAGVDETSFTEASLAYNDHVAKAFGVEDIVATPPVTTINADGTANPDFNGADDLAPGEQYGKVLAQLSAADDANDTLDTLSGALVVDEETGEAGLTPEGKNLMDQYAGEYEEKRDAY